MPIARVADGTSLWSFGYSLKLVSPFGNMNNSVQYYAFSIVNLSEPKIVYVNNYTRYVFAGWRGQGNGAYTGPASNASVEMFGNVTEMADWKLQYLVNVTSNFSSVSGSGWYNAGSAVNYSTPSDIVYQSPLQRTLFDGWNNGNRNLSGNFLVYAPVYINATWTQQFFANATSQYGNTTGSGWYNKDSIASFGLTQPIVNETSTERLAFYSWDNGNQSSVLQLQIGGPTQVQAQYRKQYLTSFAAKDTYGTYVKPPQFYLYNASVGSSSFLFSQTPYVITSVNYQGTQIPLNITFNVTMPETEIVILPLYNVKVTTTDIFGIPVNATEQLQFANKTRIVDFTGPSGEVMIDDVPYGNVTGNATYLGIREAIDVRNGAYADVIFVSRYAVLAFVAALVISTIMFVILSRRHDTPHNKVIVSARARNS